LYYWIGSFYDHTGAKYGQLAAAFGMQIALTFWQAFWAAALLPTWRRSFDVKLPGLFILYLAWNIGVKQA
jgi:hypothetical protein